MEYEDIEEDHFNKMNNLIHASKSKRLINYLIDVIGSTFLFMFIVVGWLNFMDLPEEHLQLEDSLQTRINIMLFMTLYYILMEGAFYGKTLGKYITKTRVLGLDGDYLDFRTVVKRSFLRLIPFEALSFLGHHDSGWHDRWSDTIVIDEELSTF